MSTREVYRYSWIKVSDDNGRAHMMRAALDLQHSLMERARSAQPGSAEAGFLKTQLVMARAYLGGELEHGIRVIILSSAEGGSLSLDLVTPLPHAVSHAGIEITVATMPCGYAQAAALAWMETPVGVAWSEGALACRLAHAVVTAEVSRPAPALASECQHV